MNGTQDKRKKRKEKLSPSFGINTSKYVSKVKEATISFVTRKKTNAVLDIIIDVSNKTKEIKSSENLIGKW